MPPSFAAFPPSPLSRAWAEFAPSSAATLAVKSADFLALNTGDRSEPRGLHAPSPQAQLSGTGQSPPISTSVLVNTFNHSAFIEDCIESLLVQTVLPDEIIVYDDGSTDDTVSRLRRYGTRITLIEGAVVSRASYLAQANAVQTAFKRSSGKFIFLLDGDDRFKRHKIEHYAATFAANPDASLIQAPMDKIDQHGRIIGSNIERRKHVVEHLKEIYRKQDVDFFYPTSALAFSRYYLDCVLPLDFSDGFPLWLDTRLSIIAPYFGRVITLPETLTEWRRHMGSDSVRIRSRQLQVRQTVMRTHVFNRFCRRYGLRTISTWRNARFYLQLLRLTLPETAYRIFYKHFKPRFSEPV